MEFAILAPLLVTLLFGIIEFGWLFSQNIDVRHGAREGARLAATNFCTEAAIVTEACDRMEIAASSPVEITIIRSCAAIGESLTVTVVATPTSLTGMFSAIMPATLTSEITSRLEQPPSWASMGAPITC